MHTSKAIEDDRAMAPVDLFDEAAVLHADALAALEAGIADRSGSEQISNMLREAAALEREIGEIFLARGAE